MKFTRMINNIRVCSIRLMKVCKSIEPKQLKSIISRFCRQYDRTKLGICLASGIIIISAALLVGASLQISILSDNQKVGSEQPALQESSGDVVQTQVASRGALDTSRGGQVDRASVNLLAQVIEGEAADESYEGKVAVGAVILNRTESGVFPETIPGVIYERDAFESVTNGQYQRPLSQDSLNAAMDALNGSDPTNGALYFWNPDTATSAWIWSRPIVTQIGRHVFAR